MKKHINKEVDVTKVITLSLLVVWMNCSNLAQASNTFIISIVDEGKVVSWYKHYLTKAYSELGYRLVYKPMPPGRGQLEAQKGYVDALAIRVSAIESSFLDFIRVPVFLAKGKLMLYCQIDVPCLKHILNEQRYVVGIVSGSNITSVFMKGKSASIYEVVDGIKLAEMFNRKRLNYILSIDSEDFGNYAAIDTNNFSSEPLVSIEAYHYLHKKHLDKLLEIESALHNALNSLGPIPKAYLENMRL